MPQVKLKIQNILIRNRNGRSAGMETIVVSAKEGESLLDLFRRLARENEDLNKIISQDAHLPTVMVLNGRYLGPAELSEVTLKEGDELTVLPLLDGG